MSETHPIPTVPGLAESFIGQDIEVGEATATSTVTGVFLNRAHFATTGAVTAQLRNAAGDSIEVALGVGVESARGAGSVAFASGDKVLLRITAADSASMSVGGSYDVASAIIAATTYLTSLPKVKTYLGISDTSSDAVLNELIAFVSRLMEGWMGRTIVQQATATEEHDIRDSGLVRYLTLQNRPFDSIAEVRLNGTVVDPANYEVRHGALLAYQNGTWPAGHVEVDVVNAGYATIPEDLAGAATFEVANAYRQASGDHRLGLSSKSISGQSDAGINDWTWQRPSLQAMSMYRSWP